MINIIKGSIRNVVDEAQFEKLYKPNGWQIDTTKESMPELKVPIDNLETETEVKNYIKMKNCKTNKFDDDLFYSEV